MVWEMLRFLHAVPYEMQNVEPVVLFMIYFLNFSTVHTDYNFFWFFFGEHFSVSKNLQIVRIVTWKMWISARWYILGTYII